MTTTNLHYIYDPLCGWCYGAAPLIKAAREVVRVTPHGGGMMTGGRRQSVTAQLHDYVKPHDMRIAQVSGQIFGKAYFEGLLHDTCVVFDSEPPTAAMLAAEMLAGRGLDMLTKLQEAHYVEGLRIADRSVLVEVAESLGLEAAAFAQALDSQSGKAVQAHIQQTRDFMAQVGAQGFPGFVLETERGFEKLDFSNYLGRPQAFQTWLRKQMSVAPAPSNAETWVCGIEACAVVGSHTIDPSK